MHTQRIQFVAGLLLGILCSWLFAVCYLGTIAEAGCPALGPIPGWAPNTLQNYVAVTFTSQELSRVNSAMSNWNIHNTGGLNCSNVGFYPSTFGSYVITSDTGYLSEQPAWSAATQITGTSNGHISGALTTFYWGAHDNSTPPVYAWNRNGSADYYRCVLTTALHEAGHPMGLGEATSPIAAGQTVMNPIWELMILVTMALPLCKHVMMTK